MGVDIRAESRARLKALLQDVKAWENDAPTVDYILNKLDGTRFDGITQSGMVSLLEGQSAANGSWSNATYATRMAEYQVGFLDTAFSEFQTGEWILDDREVTSYVVWREIQNARVVADNSTIVFDQWPIALREEITN